MSNDHTPCVMTTMDSFYVKACGCGVIHLCFGPTTLNLSPEVVIAVTETLREVARDLRNQLIEPERSEKHTANAQEFGNVIQGKFPMK
jgi:hypothetical protein